MLNIQKLDSGDTHFCLGESAPLSVVVANTCTHNYQYPPQAQIELSEEIKNSSISVRYKMQDVSARLSTDFRFLNSEEKEKILSGKLPRIAHCKKTPQKSKKTTSPENVSGGVLIGKSEKGGAYYAGLQSCGSVWVCPVCAERISEFRAKEIQQMMDLWIAEDPDHECLMVTFTIPHYSSQNLDYLRSTFRIARRHFRDQKVLKRSNMLVFSEIAEKYGYFGEVSSIEVTYGSSK